MKQNMWDDVFYRLNDEGEIKLCVLFCIRYAQLPLSDIELKHIMLSGTSVDFIDLCAMIDILVQDVYIKKVTRNETEKFDLTPLGTETIDMFEDKIMPSVRASLRNTTDAYFKRERKRAEVRCEIVPVDKDAFRTDISLKEGKHNLMVLSLFAGSREKANRIRHNFRKDPIGTYTKITEMLSEEFEEETD